MAHLKSELISRLEECDRSGRSLYADVITTVADELGIQLQYRDAIGQTDQWAGDRIDSEEIVSCIRENPSTLDNLYASIVSHDQRQSKGQFFTPPAVAQSMVSLLPDQGTVLDPGVGPGIFAEMVLKGEVGDTLLLNDIDPLMLCATEVRIALMDDVSTDIKLQKENFLTSESIEGIDSIVCNPPYNKFQNRDIEAVRDLEEEIGISLSGFTNTYPLFLLKAVSSVDDGRIVFITPFEFLDTGYGTVLKKYLLDSANIRAIIGLKWEEEVFNNALTTAAITIIDTNGPTEEVTFIKSEQRSDLTQIVEQFPEMPDNQPVRVKRSSELDPSGKWSRFFESTLDTEYLDATIPLSDLAEVKRGIATGHNEFFTLTKAEIEEWKLEQEHVRPVLSKAAQAPHYKFTAQDLERCYQNGKRVHLLYVTTSPSENVASYLEHGEENYEAHDRYLTSHRDPWYKPEHRDPCPILATVFSRDNMRFIHNETDALNLAAFHCVYPRFNDEKRIKALLGYLNSEPALQLAKIYKRQYADGLDKFEPGDLSDIPVLDIRRISDKQIEELAEFFTRIDAASRGGSDDLAVVHAELSAFVEQLLNEHKELTDKEKITSWGDSTP